MMNHLDLFSGIGGFSLAAYWVWGNDHNIISFCEMDKFCQKVLNKHWPDVPICPDIKEYKHDGTKIDLLTGGFPCQPFSCAGKQRGKNDDRYLWPEMLRVIREAQPKWIIGENVPGILNVEKGLVFEQVCVDLENEGYEVTPFVIPACGVDAPHRRDRVWVCANSSSTRKRRNERKKENETLVDTRCSNGKTCGANGLGDEKPGAQQKASLSGLCSGNVSNSNISRFQKQRIEITDEQEHNSSELCCEIKSNTISQYDYNRGFGTSKISQFKKAGIPNCQQWLPEPSVGRVANGIPNRVDRLKGLGNAIVPQVVAPIMEAIKNIST